MMYIFYTDYSIEKCKYFIDKIINDNNYIRDGYSGRIKPKNNRFILRKSYRESLYVKKYTSSFHGELIDTVDGTIIKGYFKISLYTKLFFLIWFMILLCMEIYIIIVNLIIPTNESIIGLFIPLFFAAFAIILIKYYFKKNKINEQNILDLIQMELNARVYEKGE